MIAQILGYLGEGIRACLGWFSNIIDAAGTYGLIIGVFTMIVMFRVLIYPLIGKGYIFGQSDKVASKLKSYKDEKGDE